MPLRRAAIALLSCAAIGALAPAAAHDFWLVPQRFVAEDDAPVQVRFMVGHAGEVDAWNLQWDRVVALRAHGPDGFADLAPTLVPASGVVPGFVRVRMDEPGTYAVAFESNHSFSELEAARFDEYALSEGLRAVIKARRAEGGAAPGREIYARRAKTLLQRGDAATDEALAPLGHTLEIVPEANPYALDGGRLPVRVLFRGAPLEGALIDLEVLGSDEGPVQAVTTDAEGRAAFDLPEGEAFKLAVVWGVPIRSERAEFETLFSSLTFGRPASRR